MGSRSPPCVPSVAGSFATGDMSRVQSADADPSWQGVSSLQDSRGCVVRHSAIIQGSHVGYVYLVSHTCGCMSILACTGHDVFFDEYGYLLPSRISVFFIFASCLCVYLRERVWIPVEQ